MKVWLTSLLLASAAYSYPDNIRRGYPSCTSCHVSPTGGGVLNDYGRAASEEFMSSFSYEGEGKLFHYVDQPEALKLGGDVRWINITAKDYHRKFFMQTEVEAALKFMPNATLVGSLGYYGEKQDHQFRRNYLLLNVNQYTSLRAGRFFPAYGIMGDDHTLVTKNLLGFGEGKETYNFEVGFKHFFGELFITSILGQSGEVRATKDNGYEVYSDAEGGFAVRAAVNWRSTQQYGLSYYYGEKPDGELRRFGGIYMMLGLTKWLYVLSQMDRKLEDKKIVHLSSSEVGVELYQGLLAIAKHQVIEAEKREDISGFGLTFRPRPHWEFKGSVDYSFTKELPVFLFLSHYHL